MFQADLFAMQEGSQSLKPALAAAVGLPSLLDRLGAVSTRPRYAFMILTLIAQAAGEGGSAGPYVRQGDRAIPIRDWLADAVMPVGRREARRRAIADKVGAELRRRRVLPTSEAEAELMMEEEVRKRVRGSAVCNVSRAVSELAKAGLLSRHYQGYCVDHENRGAQRQAVYTLTADAKRLLGGH